MAKIADFKSNIQSKIQQDITEKQKQIAASSAATKSGSTETPKVTATPKVTQTAKAMPSITRPEIAPVTIQQTTTPTVNAKDLLSTKTTPTLKQAAPDLLSKTAERQDITKSVIPLNLVRAADTQWWAAKSTVDKTLTEQFSYWLNEKPKQITEKVGSLFQKPAEKLWIWFESLINDTEFYTAKLADVIETSLWGKWWFTEAFQAQQWQYWDTYTEQHELQSSRLYDEDQKAQDLSNDVSSWLYDITWNQEVSDMLWSVAWRVYANVKDPEQVAYTVWYMLPALIMWWATWGWFWANTAIWTPSQSALVYKDFAEDQELSEKFTDNQLFWISTWFWTILSMVESFWDALWDMPWAKNMSNSIRGFLARSIRKETSKTLSKEMMDAVDKNVIKEIKKPVLNAIKKRFIWGIWEWVEEITQETIQTEGAIALGSKREHMTVEQALTIWWTAMWIWWLTQTPWAAINIKQNQDLRKEYEDFSRALDKVAPWINEETKMAFFSAMITSQQNDANLSDKKVKEYEALTTKLYEERANLEQRLKQADNDEVRAKINGWIEQTDNKIKEIDKKINQWKNTEAEINKYIEEYNQQRREELDELYGDINKQTLLPREEGGENLSEQTMVDDAVVESKPIDQMTDDEVVKAINYWNNNKPETPQERKRFKDLNNELNNRLANAVLTEEEKQWLADLTLDIDSIPFSKIAKAIVELDMLSLRESDEEKRNQYKEMERKARERVDRESQLSEQDTEKRDTESLLPWTEIDSNLFYNNWRKRTWWNIDDFSMAIFSQDRQHIPWLKDVKIWWLENLTEEDIMEVAKNAADIAWILWIDFNKILDNARFSVLNLKWQTPRWTENINWRQYTRHNRYNPDILELSIILKDTWPAVFWHELMHLLDKEYLFRNWKLFTPSGYLTKKSMIKATNYKTYNNVWNDTEYWDTSREILARYAEQYVAYKTDKWEYKKYTEKPKYRSDSAFQKLIPQFQFLLETHFSDFMLDKWDRISYPKVMDKMAELLYEQTQFMPWEESEMLYKLLKMKDQYDEISKEIENIKDETLRLEMEAELSTLYSNYEMLNQMKEDYLEKQKTAQPQQDEIDWTTTTVVPDPPQDPKVIRYWLPYFWWSNIEEGIWDIAEWWNGWKLWDSYMREETIIKIRKRKNKIKAFRKELWQSMKDLFTPTISRIYNISPRVAWRLITMETQKDINIHRYRKQAEWFVNTLWNLKWKQALEVKMALLDYWALASDWEWDIAQYKKDEVAKLKEVLLRNWFKEKDINDMFSVLDDIWRQYEDAGLKITRTDMYFPRVVKDYEWLIDYMNRRSDGNIKVNKVSLMARIRNIQADTKLTEEEKEARIRRAISVEFKQPWTTSQHGKERKMWLLSDWWEWIFAYYESPIESLDHYITTMVNAIQRQLFLWGLKEDANLDSDIINQDTAESVSQIIWKLVEDGKISEDDVAELQKSILAVLNKKPSPKSVTAIKDVTYISTITNFLSAINQLDDLWMVILRDKSWLKHIVKAIFWKANIKYDDLWLEDAYEMFREEWWITNWLFKKSLFNTFDRLGKTSFVNAAWESMMRQASNPKTRQHLYTRLQSMYWTESADRMMEKIDSGNYMTDGQIDIEILRDLLYQLWSTQPLYTSAMPTTYLNHPRARLCYALSSFTLKRIDWLVQWTKEVYKKNWWWAKWATAAWAWVMSVSFFLAMFWAAIWDAWDLLKWDKEETFLWKFINEWIDEALKSAWSDALDSWLKIWDLSEYDIKLYKQQWLRWVFAAKMKPFIFDLGKDIKQAIEKRDANEITDLAKYVPIFWKLVYYWLWDDLESSTKLELNLDNLDVDLDLDLDNLELDLDDIELDLSDFELNI